MAPGEDAGGVAWRLKWVHRNTWCYHTQNDPPRVSRFSIFSRFSNMFQTRRLHWNIFENRENLENRETRGGSFWVYGNTAQRNAGGQAEKKTFPRRQGSRATRTSGSGSASSSSAPRGPRRPARCTTCGTPPVPSIALSQTGTGKSLKLALNVWNNSQTKTKSPN